MAKTLVVRDFCKADRKGLRDLYGVAFTATYSPIFGASVAAAMVAALDASELRHMLPGQDERAAVASMADQVVGSVVAAERGRVAYVWGMYVHPAHQRCGIGTALLHHAVGWLSKAMSVQVRVLPSSPWAVAFYGRHGFREIGREPFEIAPGRTVQSLVMAVLKAALIPVGG